MSRSSLFSFSSQPGGYFISNGNTIFAKSVPSTLIAAINETKLYDIKSISVGPNGGWIACYDDKAHGGPHGDNYFGDQVPKPLETYLEAHACEDRCNPLHWVKMGPHDQWFARRVNTMNWQLMPPVAAAMLKLQQMGVQRKLEEVIFGPDNTSIFIFSNGSFMWDLPLESEEHRVLQQHYAMGTHLEAAALSFTDPGDYFFLWGQAYASFKLPDSEHAQVAAMTNTCNATRMQLVMSHRTLLRPAASQEHTPQCISRNYSTDMHQEQKIYHDNGSCNLMEAGVMSDNLSVNSPACQDVQKIPQVCPRHGNGNLRLWPAAKLVPDVSKLLSNEH